MNLKNQIESLLFISNKPLSVKQLGDLVGKGKAEVELIVEGLKQKYNSEESGIRLVDHAGKLQFSTDKDSAKAVEKFLKEELTGEMTRPQLETLTIVAYRGPVTKMELEQIRGVNCSLILRNLMMRGLVESRTDRSIGAIVYSVTHEFVRHLGLTAVDELPDYEKLSEHETLESFLNRDEEEDRKDTQAVEE